eukprot:PhM_4_TR15191/c0_g1_i1/m.93776
MFPPNFLHNHAGFLNVLLHGTVPLTPMCVEFVAVGVQVEEPVHRVVLRAAVLEQKDHARGLDDALELPEHRDGVLVVTQPEHVHNGVVLLRGEVVELLDLFLDHVVRRENGLRQALLQTAQQDLVLVHEIHVVCGVRVHAHVAALTRAELEHLAIRVLQNLLAHQQNLAGLVIPNLCQEHDVAEAGDEAEADAPAHHALPQRRLRAHHLEVLALLLRVVRVEGLHVLRYVLGVVVDVALAGLDKDGWVRRLRLPENGLDLPLTPLGAHDAIAKLLHKVGLERRPGGVGNGVTIATAGCGCVGVLV